MRNRNAGAQGNAKKMTYRNAGTRRKNQGTRECKGPQELAPISAVDHCFEEPVKLVDSQAAFTHVHGLAHAETRATSHLVSARFVWPSLAANLRKQYRQGTSCQWAKVTVQEQPAVEKVPVPSMSPYVYVHVDLEGPLPAFKGSHA